MRKGAGEGSETVVSLASKNFYITRSFASRFVEEIARVQTSSVNPRVGVTEQFLRRLEISPAARRLVASE